MAPPHPIPNARPAEWPHCRPGTLAEGMRRDDPAGCRVALLGLPDDTGVRLNSGRPGAAEGPAAFRRALSRYGSRYDALRDRDLCGLVFDAGEVPPGATLEETHRRVSEAVLALHQLGLLPVCVGGGHDLTFPAVRALSTHAGVPVCGLNVDPHLDVREQPGSGMPFRALIETGCLDPSRFVEFGTGRFTNSREHLEWLLQRGATLVGIESIMAEPRLGRAAFERIFPEDAVEPGFVSVDLDAIDGAAAPGVSAVCPMGLSVPEVAAMARRAGVHPAVRHFDLMELCPPHDQGDRTARVAALLFLTFVAAVAERAE